MRLSGWLVGVGVGCAGTVSAVETARFIGFGDLPGGIFQSQALATSADGMVVAGWSSGTADLAARRAAPSALTALTLATGALVAVSAHGVSADGLVIAGQGRTGAGARAFRWTLAGGAEDLGTLGGSPIGAIAYGISGDGRTIVGHSRSANSVAMGANEAFRWTAAGGMVALGDLAGGAFNSRALAASFDARVIVGFATSALGQEACRWHFRDGITGMGNFPSPLFNSHARGVNDDGSVIVGFGHDTQGRVAFRWTSATGLVALGDLPGGLYDSFANGVSGDGGTVVGRAMVATSDAAFVWTEATGIRDLRAWLTGEFGLNLTGWTLREATAISADAATIVGYGTNPQGRTEGWIAQLPNASLEGRISVPGYGGDLGRLRVTIELRAPGGTAARSRRMTMPDAQGRWRLTTRVFGPTDVLVRVRGSLFTAVRNVHLTTAGVTGLDTELLLADIVPDNEVNIDDYLALAASYEASPTSPAYNPDADLDGNDVVDIDDYLMVAAQFGRRGD